MEEKTYPHLSPKKLQDLQTVGATVEQIRKADCDAKKEVDERLIAYTLIDENGLDENYGSPRVRLGVIGTDGSGKSATANTLLRDKSFCESSSAISETTKFEAVTSRSDPLLTVTDTPGSWNLPNPKEHHVDLYILVINLASPRFGKQELSIIQKLKDYNNIIKSKRCIVLLTHASDALQGRSLYEYVQEIKGDPLHDLIIKDMEGWRVMAINNNCDTKYEADKQHEMVVKVLRNTYKEANFNKDRCDIDCSIITPPGCDTLTKRSRTMIMVLPLVAASVILIWYYASDYFW